MQYTKGYRGRSKNCFSIAIRRLHKAWQYAYRDRKTKKRVWRTLWIQRIQAGVRQYNIRYSRFIRSLSYCNIYLNRKVLSELAATEPFTFKAIIDVTYHQQQVYDKEQQEKNITIDDRSNQNMEESQLEDAA
jgi:large subunit ribosomal protein L20